MKRIGASVLLIIFLFSLSGCSLIENTPLKKIVSNNFIDNTVKKIQALFNNYPKTQEELAIAFAKALKNKDEKKIRKYLPLSELKTDQTPKNYIEMAGGKDFNITKVKNDRGGTYFLLENKHDKNDKYMIYVTKFNNRFVTASMGSYDPQALIVE